MSTPRQDFLLQPFDYGNGEITWDFPLDDTIVDGVYLPTPYGDSDDQHIIDIIVGVKGGLKQFPLLGFGLFSYLNGEFISSQIFSALSTNMKMDGYTVKQGCIQSVQGGGFTINRALILPAY